MDNSLGRRVRSGTVVYPTRGFLQPCPVAMGSSQSPKQFVAAAVLAPFALGSLYTLLNLWLLGAETSAIEIVSRFFRDRVCDYGASSLCVDCHKHDSGSVMDVIVPVWVLRNS